MSVNEQQEMVAAVKMYWEEKADLHRLYGDTDEFVSLVYGLACRTFGSPGGPVALHVEAYEGGDCLVEMFALDAGKMLTVADTDDGITVSVEPQEAPDWVALCRGRGQLH